MPTAAPDAAAAHHARTRRNPHASGGGDPRPATGAGERGELLPEGGVLQGEIDAAAEGAEKEQEEAGHGWASGDGDRKDNDRRQYEFWRATGYDSRARQFGSTYAITSR